LFHLEGPARSLLSGERSALNFLQLLSGVATRAQFLADLSPAPRSSCSTPAKPCPACAWRRSTP
jgi:nicotinate-nucleotide pyrophosphorylase